MHCGLRLRLHVSQVRTAYVCAAMEVKWACKCKLVLVSAPQSLLRLIHHERTVSPFHMRREGLWRRCGFMTPHALSAFT